MIADSELPPASAGQSHSTLNIDYSFGHDKSHCNMKIIKFSKLELPPASAGQSHSALNIHYSFGHDKSHSV